MPVGWLLVASLRGTLLMVVGRGLGAEGRPWWLDAIIAGSSAIVGALVGAVVGGWQSRKAAREAWQEERYVFGDWLRYWRIY